MTWQRYKEKRWSKRWALRHTMQSVKQKECIINWKRKCFVWQLKWEQVQGNHRNPKQKEAQTCPWGKWWWLIWHEWLKPAGGAVPCVWVKSFVLETLQCWFITTDQNRSSDTLSFSLKPGEREHANCFLCFHNAYPFNYKHAVDCVHLFFTDKHRRIFKKEE